jgi:beta-phosphoglucomutase-like phosphatase (HAD superfamily)
MDDTLLNNKTGNYGQGLHERSRLAAVHEIGKRHDIKALAEMSIKDSMDAFLTAPAHTAEAAVWNILFRAGLVDDDLIDRTNPLFIEIIELKHQLHKTILLNEGEEVPGATDFVQKLAANGLSDKLAVASMATRGEVDLFLGKTGLDALFPIKRIKTIESATHPKPNPEVFNLAFESLNLPESDKLLVCAFEDDPRGIMSARAAGLYVCAITTRFSKDELMNLEFPPHLVADTYAEFCDFFKLNSCT